MFRLNSAIFVAVIGVLLTNCSVGPDYEAPTIELPSAWVETLKQPPLPGASSLEAYWSSLKDPVLDNLIQQVDEENLTLQLATLRVEEALASYGVAKGGYFPDIELTGDLKRRRRSEAVASAISNPNNEFASVGGVLEWELDLLGRIRRLNESAKAQVEVQQEEARSVLVTIHAELASSYIQLRTLQTEIRLTQENIRTQRESLSLARDRFQAGIAPELDVRQAESNLGATEAALPLLRKSFGKVKHKIAVLIGGYPEHVEKLLNEGKPLPKLPDLSKETLPFNVIRQRPDLRSAERRLAAQHALIGAAEAELYPIVSFPGFFSFEALNTLENTFRSDSLAYSIGPSVRLQFLDFGRTRNRIEVEDLRTQQLERAYRQQVLIAVQEVEDSLISLTEEKVRARSLKRSVDASRKAANLVKSLYVSGLTDFQNVLDSERRLFLQEISLAESEGELLSSYIALFRALGGGWQQQASEDKSTTAPQKPVAPSKVTN